MLSAADTMADNYRMQEEAERQERERVYKRKMLEEAMAQKKKAEEEAQLQYKRQQQAAKDNAVMNSVLGDDASVYQMPKKRVAATSGVPNSTADTYTPPAYIPKKGDASAALYRYRANAATDEDKNNLIVSDKLSPSNYQKQVVNVGISPQGVQLLRDYGFDVENMTGEEQIRAVKDINMKLAKANVASRKQAAVDLRNGLAGGVNATQEMLYEKNKARSFDDMFEKLDAQIKAAEKAAEEELKNDKELIYYRNMASRVLSDPKFSKLRDERIKYIRDKHNLDGLIAYRDALQKAFVKDKYNLELAKMLYKVIEKYPKGSSETKRAYEELLSIASSTEDLNLRKEVNDIADKALGYTKGELGSEG
jgi:hypothetical protein